MVSLNISIGLCERGETTIVVEGDVVEEAATRLLADESVQLLGPDLVVDKGIREGLRHRLKMDRNGREEEGEPVDRKTCRRLPSSCVVRQLYRWTRPRTGDWPWPTGECTWPAKGSHKLQSREKGLPLHRYTVVFLRKSP